MLPYHVTTSRRADPTTSYYDRVIQRAIDEAAAAHCRPRPPLEGDAATPLFWARWRRATRTDRPRTPDTPAETYDPQELRDRLREVGIHEAQYPEVARETLIGRSAIKAILYGRGSHSNLNVTPAVKRLIEWIEDAESLEWSVS